LADDAHALNAIGYCSEAAYHHPESRGHLGGLVVKLSTHSAGGITDKDFALAGRIEEVALWRRRGGALEGTPNKFVRPATLADARSRPVRHRTARRAVAAARPRAMAPPFEYDVTVPEDHSRGADATRGSRARSRCRGYRPRLIPGLCEGDAH